MSAIICHTHSLPLCGLLLLLSVAGCSSPLPADQFKQISDAKKAALTTFLESKQSKLSRYTAIVTEETNVDLRGDHTHVGLIEFAYAGTEGEGRGQGIETATAEYHFSAKEKKWVYKACLLKREAWLGSKEKLLVTFTEVKAEFEK